MWGLGFREHVGLGFRVEDSWLGSRENVVEQTAYPGKAA